MPDVDFLWLVISRQEIESGDISGPLATLRNLLDPENAIRFCERVDVAFDGYNDDSRELYEIPEVRDYVCKLDDAFPFWLYFLSKRHGGLMSIILCFLPPFLTPEAQTRIHPLRMGEYLLKRGLPAMNHVASLAGCSEAEIERLTNRAMKYLQEGRDCTEM